MPRGKLKGKHFGTSFSRGFWRRHPTVIFDVILAVIVMAIAVWESFSSWEVSKPWDDAESVLIAVIYPTVVTICSVAISLSEEKIHGISRLSFNRLRVGFHLHFLEAVIVMVALGLGYFISGIFDLSITFYVLCAVSVGYSLFFAIPEILLLVKSPGFVHRVLRRYWLFEIKRGCNRGPDQETEDFHTVMTEVVLTEGLVTAYRFVTRPSLLQKIGKKMLPNEWVGKIGLSENQKLLIAQTLIEWQNDFLENVLSSGKRGLNKKGMVLGQIRYEDLVGQVYGNAIDVIAGRDGLEPWFRELLDDLARSIALIAELAPYYEEADSKSAYASAFYKKLLALVVKVSEKGNGQESDKAGDHKWPLPILFLAYGMLDDLLSGRSGFPYIRAILKYEPALLDYTAANPLWEFASAVKRLSKPSRRKGSIVKLPAIEKTNGDGVKQSAQKLMNWVLEEFSRKNKITPNEDYLSALKSKKTKSYSEKLKDRLLDFIYEHLNKSTIAKDTRIVFKVPGKDLIILGFGEKESYDLEKIYPYIETFYSGVRYVDGAEALNNAKDLAIDLLYSIFMSLDPLIKDKKNHGKIFLIILLDPAVAKVSPSDVVAELRGNGSCVQGRYSYFAANVYEKEGWYDRVYLANDFMGHVDKMVFGWKIYIADAP